MRKYLFIILFLFNNIANAADHLEPEYSFFYEMEVPPNLIFPDCRLNTTTTLAEAYGKNITIRAMIFPSFRSEYAVGIREEETGFSIFHLKVGKQILSNMTAPRTKAANDSMDTEQDQKILEKYEIIQCARHIDTPLAGRIENIWRSMLYDTRYDRNKTYGLDGTDYHFAMKDSHQDLAGQTWSPEKHSKTGMLVEITGEMVRYCNDKKATTDDLSRKVNTLSLKLDIVK